MFPTLFYIFVLIYEGLFSPSSVSYNEQIAVTNQLIKSKDYKQALISAQEIRHSSIFLNPEIERLIAILDLKITSQKKEHITVLLKSSTLESDVLLSHFLAKEGKSVKGLADLHKAILDKGNVDTLVKTYELYAFYFPQNKLKKQAKSTQMISTTQKINTQEALSLLDLMKKKQKNFIY